MAANNAFHAEVAAVGGNAVLAELADIVGRRVQWYYRMVAPERGHGSWTEHAEMIEAIEAGDAERAQALARKHTERTRLAYHRVLIQWFALFRSTSGTSPTLRVPTARTGSNGPCSLVGSE